MKNFSVKKLFFFFFSFLILPQLYAQDSFRLNINSIFQNVDKTQIPTKYLKEVGFPFPHFLKSNLCLNTFFMQCCFL